MTGIGIVIIGRNEGDRLRRCLCAVRRTQLPAVYVDSGSTDGSAALARSMIGCVVELDDSRPFTAARGRNAGFTALLSWYPEIAFVQFVDGDCLLSDEWISRAGRELLAHPELAIVCGRLRELRPEASIYNRLCEMVWNAGTGEVKSCGGIFMARAEAFEEVDGFDSTILAGEEPELCVRLRRAGWKIKRIDTEMASHDAAMTRFGQWWRRAVRSGYGAAEGAWRRSTRADLADARRVASIVMWSAAIPMAAVLPAVMTGGWSLLLLAAYPFQWLRLSLRRINRSLGDRCLLATFTLVAKWAGLVGLIRFAATQLHGPRRRDLAAEPVFRGTVVTPRGARR